MSDKMSDFAQEVQNLLMADNEVIEGPKGTNVDVKVGDRIVVTKPLLSFGDYEKGDTAVITKLEFDVPENGAPNVLVHWEERKFDDDIKEENRASLLYPAEYTIIRDN